MSLDLVIYRNPHITHVLVLLPNLISPPINTLHMSPKNINRFPISFFDPQRNICCIGYLPKQNVGSTFTSIARTKGRHKPATQLFHTPSDNINTAIIHITATSFCRYVHYKCNLIGHKVTTSRKIYVACWFQNTGAENRQATHRPLSNWGSLINTSEVTPKSRTRGSRILPSVQKNGTQFKRSHKFYWFVRLGALLTNVAPVPLGLQGSYLRQRFKSFSDS